MVCINLQLHWLDCIINFILMLSYYFSNGLLDPWSSGGVLHNVSDTLTAIVLRSGAHHLDLRAQQSNDPVELSRARGMEISIMIKWIEDYYRKQSN